MSSTVLRILAIVLALGAVIVGYIGYQASQPAPEIQVVESDEVIEIVVPTYDVLIAKRGIRAGQTLAKADVEIISVPHRPAYAYEDIEAVLDRMTRVAISANELIIQEHFHDVSPLVAAIGEGERAIAVRVDEVTGTGGFIEPGDKVDVLLFLASGQETGNTSSAQRILSDVRVLAYGDALNEIDHQAIKQKSHIDQTKQPSAESRQQTHSTDTEQTGKNSKTAVLAVTEANVSKLLLAESAGRLRLALLGVNASVGQTVFETPVDERKALQQRVTLDAFGAVTMPKPSTPVVTTQHAAPKKPSEIKIKVLRGTEASTVSVAQEN